MRAARAFERLAAAVIRRRRVWTVVAAVGALVLGAAALRVQADFSAVGFFGRGDDALIRLTEHKDRWGADDAWILVVAEADGDVLTGPRRQAFEQLTASVAAQPQVLEVISALDLPALPPGAGLDLRPWRALDALPRPDDPLVVPELRSVDGRSAAVFALLDVDADDVKAVRPAVLALRDALPPPGGPLRVELAGIPAVRADFFRVILQDQLLTVPALGLLVIVLLRLLFGATHAVAAPLLAAIVPTLAVFAAMGLLGEPLGILNQSYATLLPAIALADAIHLVGRFHDEARGAADRSAALARAAGRIGVACLLTSLTTAVGFASLAAADMPILRHFGLFAAAGVAFAWLSILVLGPLALSYARVVPAPGRLEAALDRALARGLAASLAYPARVIAAAIGVALVAGWGATRVEVDNELTAMLPDTHATSRANRRVDRDLGGILGIDAALSGPPGALHEPDVLVALEGFERAARATPGVRAATGPGTWFARLNEAITGRAEVPSDPRAIAQIGLLAADVLDRMISADAALGRCRLRLIDDRGNATLARIDALEADVRERLRGTGVHASLVGTPRVAYRGINGVTEDLRSSLGLAFLVVAGCILLLLRDLRLAAIALPVNALPLLVAYGLLGYVGWPLDPTPAVVFTVGLGLAVDDTIHVLARFQELRAGGLGRDDALRGAIQGAGRAVAATSVVLGVAFAANGLSSFPMMRALAALGATLVGAALLADVLLLPALIRVALPPGPTASRPTAGPTAGPTTAEPRP